MVDFFLKAKLSTNKGFSTIEGFQCTLVAAYVNVISNEAGVGSNQCDSPFSSSRDLSI